MAHVSTVSDHVVAAAADPSQTPLSAAVAVDPSTVSTAAYIRPTPAARDQILTRRAVEGLIADGHTIVILDGQVLQLDKWLEKHPGGKLPLLQMIGVDASSEIKA